MFLHSMHRGAFVRLAQTLQHQYPGTEITGDTHPVSPITACHIITPSLKRHAHDVTGEADDGD